MRALESVNARIHFVRWIDMQQGRRAHTQAEHMRIVQALERRDIEALPAMMGAHRPPPDQITDVIRTGFSNIYMRDQADPAQAAQADTTTGEHR